MIDPRCVAWGGATPRKVQGIHLERNITDCQDYLQLALALGEEAIELTPGMAIRIPRDVPHNLVNTGDETITCLVTFSSGDRQTVFLK
jgi:hypothetical protein